MRIWIGIFNIDLEDLMVNDDKKEMLQNACEYWELAFLEVLFKRRILTEEEYTGISQIVRENYKIENCV